MSGDPFPDIPVDPDDGLQVRWTVPLDALRLRKALQEEETLRWFPFSQGKELDDAVTCWMSFAQYHCSLTAMLDGKWAGIGVLYPFPYQKMRHQALFYLLVPEPMRGKKVATHLLRNLMYMGRTRFHLEFIHADVYEGCPILPLVARAGFTCCFRQEDFIEDQGRRLARHLMQKDLRGIPVEQIARRDG